MSLDLKSLPIEQLKSLEARLSVSLMGVQGDISKARKRLNSQQSKLGESSQILDALKLELENAQNGLTVMQNLNAPAADVTKQQAVVDAREAAYQKALYDGSTFTQAAAAEEEYEIAVLQQEVTTRQQQIDAVKDELATR